MTSGAAARPVGRDGSPPSVPPLVTVTAGGSDLRSWVAAVTRLAWRSRTAAGGLLLFGTVLPAALAPALISQVALAFAKRAGHAAVSDGGLGWGVILFPAVPLLPLVIAGGYVIARAWTGTAWVTALRAAGQPARTEDGIAGGRRCLVLWAAYVAGVVGLCVVAGAAGDLMSDDRLVRAVAAAAGPLGLLGPVILLAPARIYAGHARPAKPGGGGLAAAGRLGLLTCVVLAYQVGVGIALSAMVSAAGDHEVLGVALALLLSIPSTLLLAAAGQVNFAARHVSREPG